MIKIFVSVLLLCFLTSLSFATNSRNKKITIEAKVVKIGTPPKIRSGARRLVYQLVKYEVLKVKSGKLTEKFVVVDHLIIFDSDIITFQEGDTVILELFPRSKISVTTFEEGIREEQDTPKVFYIQGKVARK